jgi:hypothetical protein
MSEQPEWEQDLLDGKIPAPAERKRCPELEAAKANLASLNEIVVELAQRVAGASDSEFVELVLSTLRGHSFDLGFEFQGERGPSSYEVPGCEK